MYGTELHTSYLIKDRSEMDWGDLVYNIEVSGTNTYMANGIAVHNCQYTGQRYPPSKLTVDHVVPKSQGGKSTWENCVTSSLHANAHKGDRTPAQAGMQLLSKPTAPTQALATEYVLTLPTHPDWHTYFPDAEVINP